MEIFNKHPEWPHVKEICQTLTNAGFIAWLAGGCVRDGILDILPQDFDVATNASPDQIEGLFPKTVAVGKAFGVIRVIQNGSDIEVATFRKDGAYEDGRHPTTVTASTPEEDAHRRDFTINALFYDPITKKVEDYVHGKADIQKKIIRTVGLPEERFQEDRLRIMRAVRFVSQLDFYLDQETLEAVKRAAPKLTSVSWERIHDEMAKLLKGERPDRGVALIEETGLLPLILPEVLPQNINHGVFKKSGGNELLGWLALLKETSKKDRTYAYTRLKFSSEKKKTVEGALDNLQSLARFSELKLAQKKRVAASPTALLAEEYAAIDHLLNQSDESFLKSHRTLPKPFVEAADLINLGLKPGKLLGETLHKMYDAQLNEEVKNKAELLAQAGVFF